MSRKLFVWSTVAVVGVTIAAAAAIHLGRREAPRQAATPSVAVPDGLDVPGLLRRLEASGLRLHAVPTNRATGDLRSGAYLCEPPREWEEVCFLMPRADHAARWRGVVAVWPARSLYYSPDDVDVWGVNGLRAGPFVLFGDEAMLRRIADALAG